MALVDSEEPALRLFLGTCPYPIAKRIYAERPDIWREWHHLAAAADA